MNVRNFPTCKCLRTFKTRQQVQYEEIIRAQKSIELKMIELNQEIQKVINLSQNIYIKTKQVVQSALISALLGVCIVTLIEGFEMLFPVLRQNIMYIFCKTLGLCALTILYILRSTKR